MLPWSVCQGTGWGCLPPVQGLEESTEHPHSLGVCSQPRLQSVGWLLCGCWPSLLPLLTEMPLPPLLLKLWSNPSTAGNRPQASRPQGLLNHPRCLLLWQFPWLTPTSDTLAVVSPRLSGGGFPGGFESLVCWCFVAFKWPFSIFHVEVQCLIRERLSTGKSCGFGEPGFLVPLS